MDQDLSNGLIIKFLLRESLIVKKLEQYYFFLVFVNMLQHNFSLEYLETAVKHLN